MSLIQEALKRQQQEADPDAGATPEVATTPPIPDIPSAIKSKEPVAEPAEQKPVKKPIGLVKSTPPPAPEAAAVPADKNKKKKGNKKKKKKKDGNPWQKLILVLLILALIIVGAAGLVFFSLKKLSTETLTKLTENLPAEIVEKLPADVIAKLPADIQNQQPDQQPEEATSTPVQQPVATESKSAVVKVLQKVAPTPPEVKPKTKVEPVKWPDLKLIGAVASGGSGQAILNGKFINVGNSIEGVTLKAIKGSSVILTYKNETKTLKVGDSTR